MRQVRHPDEYVERLRYPAQFRPRMLEPTAKQRLRIGEGERVEMGGVGGHRQRVYGVKREAEQIPLRFGDSGVHEIEKSADLGITPAERGRAAGRKHRLRDGVEKRHLLRRKMLVRRGNILIPPTYRHGRRGRDRRRCYERPRCQHVPSRQPHSRRLTRRATGPNGTAAGLLRPSQGTR